MNARQPRAIWLAVRRAKQRPVVAHAGWSDDYAEALKQLVMPQTPAHALPANLVDLAYGIAKVHSDLVVTNGQWAQVFYGTTELRFRRRGIDTTCRDPTNIGVESTARNARELGFNLIIAEDACTPPAVSSIRAV